MLLAGCGSGTADGPSDLEFSFESVAPAGRIDQSLDMAAGAERRFRLPAALRERLVGSVKAVYSPRGK